MLSQPERNVKKMLGGRKLKRRWYLQARGCPFLVRRNKERPFRKGPELHFAHRPCRVKGS